MPQPQHSESSVMWEMSDVKVIDIFGNDAGHY